MFEGRQAVDVMDRVERIPTQVKIGETPSVAVLVM